nr:hypothetical protein [Tanacetum cinerariifolium]
TVVATSLTEAEYVVVASCCAQVLWIQNQLLDYGNNVVYFSAIPRDGIFKIDLSNSYTNESSIYAVSNKRAKLDLDYDLLWHCRLGHISKKCIEKLQQDGLLDSSVLRDFEKCVSCMSGKMARKPYTHQVERAKDLLRLIHTDVCGPFKIMSRQGASYFVTFTDNFIRYGYVYLLKHKHEVFETFKVFQKEVENQLGKTIKSLCSDRGGEYMSQEFFDHLKDHGIIAHRTPPYTSQHNGVSERKNKTLLDMVRSMMSQTTLSKSFWDYALETDACILNMVLTKKVEKTPYKALVKQDTLTKPNKLEPKSIKCIFLGYLKETIGYSFYHPPKNKVLVARNAKFLESSLINQEASGSPEDLEIIQKEDTHPSLDTSLNHEEDDLEIDEPKSDIVSIRRSTRTRHAPDHMCLYIDAEEHELGDLREPANYKAALLDQDKWLFKKKTDMDGNVHIYKARIMAKGYTQTPRIDYEETFSIVADIRAIRILIAKAVYYDYEIWQWMSKLISSMDISIKNIPMLQSVKTYLGNYFTMKDLGEAAYILGIKIYKDKSKRLIGLCQSVYIEKILKQYCMKNSKRRSITMQEKLKLSKSQGASTPAELKGMQNVPYASVNPVDIHWTTVKNILKYLRNTKDMFLVYGEVEYIAAFDASKEAVLVSKFISGLCCLVIREFGLASERGHLTCLCEHS